MFWFQQTGTAPVASAFRLVFLLILTASDELQVFSNELVLKFPPSKKYRLAFLRQLMNQVWKIKVPVFNSMYVRLNEMAISFYVGIGWVDRSVGRRGVWRNM